MRPIYKITIMVLLAVILGLALPELWRVFQNPKRWPWLIMPFILVGLLVFFLTNGNLAITLFFELLALFLIGLGIGLTLSSWRK